MKLEQLSHLSQIVSSIAVLVTLIFLVVELRENTEATQAAAYQNLVSTSNVMLAALATDAQLANIVMNAWREGIESLSQADRDRFFAYHRAVWRNYENSFFQRQHGVLDDEEWSSYARLMCNDFLNFNEYFITTHKHMMAESFTGFLATCKR